jgi:uncharacterized membrane protein YfcA
MIEYLLLGILGIIIGFLGTLIGAGGGFILMPVLLFLYPKESPDTLTAISLSATFVNSLSGTIAYIRMKRVNFKYGIIFAASSIPGAAAGAYLTQFVNRSIFSLIFAMMLVSVAVFIFFTTMNNRDLPEIHEIKIDKTKLVSGMAISIFIGMISSFLGIGGGIIHVPMLSNIITFPVHAATATSHFILSITSLTGLIVHIVSGKFKHGLGRAIFISAGAMIGAQLGAMLSSKVKGKFIIRILSIALFIVGARLVMIFLCGILCK